MRRLWAVMLVAGVLGTVTITTAAPAGAADAKGCKGSGRSIGASGLVIDRASAPGAGGTEDNPFKVETKGKIAYDYSVNRGALSGGKWTATIIDPSGIGIIPDISFSGRIDAGSSQSGSGVEPLDEHLRVGGLALITGTFQMKIKARAGGVNCVVIGYLEISDSPVKSVIFIESALLLLIAIYLFYLAMMGQMAPAAADVAMEAIDEATGHTGSKS